MLRDSTIPRINSQTSINEVGHYSLQLINYSFIFAVFFFKCNNSSFIIHFHLMLRNLIDTSIISILLYKLKGRGTKI